MIKETILGLGIALGSASTVYAQQSLSLVPGKSPKEAMAADACSHYYQHRTQLISLVNNTSIGLELWLVQGRDEVGAPNSDFVEDTGVFVGAVDRVGNARYTADPCYAGGYRRPIQATRLLGSARFKNGQTLHFQDIVANSGEYIKEGGWTVGYGATSEVLVVNPIVPSSKKTPAKTLSLMPK